MMIRLQYCCTFDFRFTRLQVSPVTADETLFEFTLLQDCLTCTHSFLFICDRTDTIASVRIEVKKVTSAS